MKTLLVISTLILFLFSSNSCSKKETVKEEEDTNITGAWQNVSAWYYEKNTLYKQEGRLFFLSIISLRTDGTIVFCSAKFFMPYDPPMGTDPYGNYSFVPHYFSYEEGNGTYNYVDKKLYVSINENDYITKDYNSTYTGDAFKFSPLNGSSVELKNDQLIIDKRIFKSCKADQTYYFHVDPLKYVKDRRSSYTKNFQPF